MSYLTNSFYFWSSGLYFTTVDLLLAYKKVEFFQHTFLPFTILEPEIILKKEKYEPLESTCVGFLTLFVNYSAIVEVEYLSHFYVG